MHNLLQISAWPFCITINRIIVLKICSISVKPNTFKKRPEFVIIIVFADAL